MLEGLKHINWTNLEVIEGGDAQKIPEALRNLMSNDPAIRRASYWQLDNQVVVQSDLYNSAWYIVPFLLEILASNPVNGRLEVYDLLYEIGNGGAPPEKGIAVSENLIVPLQAACRQAVVKGLDLYIEEVLNTYSPAREKALELIGSLQEDNDIVTKKLEMLFSKEKDPAFREKIRELLEGS